MRLFIFLLFIFSTITLPAKDYYVSKTGDDNNPGTEAEPFQTISKAASIMVAGDVCIIKEGIYRELLHPKNGGTANAPIVFKAFEEDNVVISATESLNDWQPHNGQIYKHSVEFGAERYNMIYFEGDAMDWARWPNNADQNPYTIDAMTVEGGADNRIDATELPAGIDLTDAYVWYLGAHSGTSWTRKILSNTSSAITHVKNDINKWPFNPHNPTVFRNGNRGRFFIFGSMDLLDTPREWYYNKQTKEVFFIPPNNQNPNNANIEYSVRERTILLEKPYITIEGINTFGGIVNIKAANCTIRGAEILQGYQALDELDNTDAQDSRGAVWVQASNTLIEDNLIYGGSLNGISVQGWGGVSDITIKGNEIREFNTVGNHSSPIRCRAPRSIVTQNTLAGSGRDGIFIPALDCEISWNDVYDCMRINNDGGLFYVVGNQDDKNTTIHHNWFHDSYGPDYADGRCAGIYLDNDSKGYDVHHNVVWNISWSGVQMNWDAWNNDIFNNTLWAVEDAMDIWLNNRTQKNNRVWNNYANTGSWEGQDIADNLISSTDQFIDVSKSDFRPKNGSELIDAGREIPGITDGFEGSAPDIGAYESGQDLWIPGAPRAKLSTSLFPTLAPVVNIDVFPNPAINHCNIVVSTGSTTSTNWGLFSKDGKKVMTGTTVFSESVLELNTTGLPAGAYLFRTIVPEGIANKIIVITR